ncbi:MULTISPECIES: hypothetical protein [Leclercia]
MSVETKFPGQVMAPDEDSDGVTAIAEGLGRSISMLDMNVSTVIGIEER